MMTRLNLILFFLIVALLAIDGVLCGLTEKEMDDLESDMAIGMRRFKKTKEEEAYIKDRLCARNLKAKEWENLSRYCFDYALNGNKCEKCREVFVKSYEICNNKVKQTDGCNEITFNKVSFGQRKIVGSELLTAFPFFRW